jgi:hypothetical protein
MKKLSFIILLFTCHFGTAQQRLALLPTAIASATQASTLCIDYFEAVPKKTENLHFIDGEASQSNLNLHGADTYNHANITGTTGAGRAATENIAYFGTNGANGSIPSYYKKFIEERTQFYTDQINKGHSTKAKLREALQHDVWEFDILDKMGYINRSASPSADFGYARQQFQTYNSDLGKKASALMIGDEIYTTAAKNLTYQSISHEKFNYYIVHYERGTGRYLVFDGHGHIITSASTPFGAQQALISRATDNENVYIKTLNFENETKGDAFLTNANLEGFKGGKKISFQRYSFQDVCTGGRRYAIPKQYNTSDISTTTLDGKTYSFFPAKFREKTTYVIKDVEVDSYSTKSSVLQDLVNKINDTFEIGKQFDNTKQSISLATFLSKFKREVKTIHGITREDEFIMLIKQQAEPVGVVKIYLKKDGFLGMQLLAKN